MMNQINTDHGLPSGAINALISVFNKHHSIQSVILYGSRAKGTFHTGSDIDLCLIAPTMTLSEQLMIENQIDDLLLPWKIDLSVKHKIESVSLIEHIERVGVLFLRKKHQANDLK